MTEPMPLPSFAQGALNRYTRMKSKAAPRDRNHELIHQVRRGHIRQLFPSELEFSLDFEGSPIANFVDIVAHDMAEGIAPLPALACVSGKMQTDADLKRAEIKNRIGDNYWRHSRLEIQMLKGADRYVTYGFVPFFLEPDTKNHLPYIHVEDPRNAYYELDRWGNCVVYAKRWLRSVDDLCAKFPEYEGIIRTQKDGKKATGDTLLELVRYVDDKLVMLILPDRHGLVLGSYEHLMGQTPVVVAERPSEDDSPRGQFDDVIWVQVARAIMSTLALEAASLAVQAPIAIPEGMDEFPIGPHAILQGKDAGQVHRVNIEVPPTIFAEGQALDQELRLGSRYPDARTGGVQASVITGKGVEALLGTFDSQIKGAQMIFKAAFEDLTAICFKMDETWWPHQSKTVSGTLSGSSYEFNYTPTKDIAGRHLCTVTYGFAAGLNPSQSIVTMLQLEGAGLIAKGTTQQNLPFGVDPQQEMQKINVEGSREALKQGVFALVQASGQMAAQGQDPTPIIQLSVDMIRGLQNGKPVEEAVSQAYAILQQKAQQAQEAAEEAQEQAMGQQGGAPGGAPDQGGGDQFQGANGSPEAGVPGRQAPGQAGQAPGGRPTMAEMVSGFRGNGDLPVNQFDIRRAVPTGT
jgi:hypothetical protein